jgi:hypothetical protein
LSLSSTTEGDDAVKRTSVGIPALALLMLSACTDSRPDPLAPGEPDFLFGSPSGLVLVTNEHASGPGSFAQAIATANTNSGVQRIAFAPRVSSIALEAPVAFTGAQALMIDGNRVTLDGAGLPAGASGFTAAGGGSLEIKGLAVRRAPGAGITVAIPATALGTIKISLIGVRVTDNGSHGVLINDQAEYFTDPNSTSADGSSASLDVLVAGSTFTGNGFTALDQDGLRINEGGAGNLRAAITLTSVQGNGGDGVELDERGTGDVLVSVLGTGLIGNGSFSAEDFDDGIDIDESGEGSIVGGFLFTSANENFEQGFDLNENDAGDLRVDMTLVEAIGNHEEGIEYEEDDDVAGGGDIVATLIGVRASGNGAADGDAGLKLREKGVGNLDVQLKGIESSANLVDGALLREDADGDLTATLQNVVTNGNTGDGIEFDENAAGNLTGVVAHATANTNTQAGIRGDQGGAGAGTLQLTAVATVGNLVAAVVTNPGIVLTQTP